MLRPLRPARNRTDEVVDRLLAELNSGRLSPGDRLPTEQEMMAGMGVSRTVVREAVASLKAQGLVLTRQGSGAFVAAEPGRRGFSIDPDGVGSIERVLHILELRLAVETEAAAFAARRATARDIRAIRAALRAFERAVAAGEAAVAEDFAFHGAIAAATGNPQFSRFLEYLGRFIIPRQTVRARGMSPAENARYMRRIVDEHRAIGDAIAARDAAAARDAVRRHLTRSGERYGAFASRGPGI